MTGEMHLLAQKLAEPSTVFPFLTLRRALADALYPEGRERRERAERDANTDELTGLGNARAFHRALRTAEMDAAVAVLSFDINHFKRVNDEDGHTAGDRMLVEAARSLTAAAAVYGYGGRVFRTGGDEFTILCGAEIAEELRDRAERYFGNWPGGVSISGTIGSTYREADDLLQARKAERKGNSRG